MKSRYVIIVAVMLTFAPPMSFAGGSTQQAAAQRQAAEAKLQATQENRQQLEQQLQEARAKLQELAQRVAQLSLQLSGPDWNGGGNFRIYKRLRSIDMHRAILGITIASMEKQKMPDDGVKVVAVTPGGPADTAGLRAGDVITAINDKSFAATKHRSPNDMLLAFMDTVKPGDALKVTYRRDGKAATANLTAGKLDRDSFDFAFDMPPMPPVPPAPPAAPEPPMPPAAPEPPMPPHLAWFIDTDQPWGDMQLVPLTPTLGQYFGTDKGLLVVHVAKHDALKLQDGDVILNIGGRDPGSPPHAMRILRSYNAGETVTLEIMRKGKPVKLDVKLPDAAQQGGGGISELYRDFQFGPAFLHFGFE